MIGEFPTQRDFCPNREIEVNSSCFVWKAREASEWKILIVICLHDIQSYNQRSREITASDWL